MYIYIYMYSHQLCVCVCVIYDICKYRVPHHSHWWWPFNPTILGSPVEPSHQTAQCHLLNESPCLAIFEEPDTGGFQGAEAGRNSMPETSVLQVEYLNGSGSYCGNSENAMVSASAQRPMALQIQCTCPRVLPPADPCRAFEVMAGSR